MFQINNPTLYGLYLLYKEELEKYETSVREVMLYHATSRDFAISIVNSNINWQYTLRSRFGNGACFSDCPAYAHEYSSSIGGKYIFCIFL